MSRRVSSPRFIGRANELSQLEARLAQAEAGEPTFVLVAGEAGVGKTRLISAFAERARSSGTLVLVGGCLELGEDGLPYAPIVEALRALAAELGPEEMLRQFGSGRADLARLIPGLAIVESSADGSDPGAQGRLFEHFLGLVGRLGADRPVALVIEDLHWADGSTRDLLMFLKRNLRSEHALVVATLRSDELHRRHPVRPLLSEMDRDGGVERIELARFDRAETAEQLAAILDSTPAPDLVEQLFRRSDGNPFFVEELVASGIDESARLPSTLQEIITARVGRLGEAAQSVLRTMAVLGRRVEHDLIAQLTGLEAATLLGAIREAVDERLIVPTDDRDGSIYEFRHALVVEALYDDLLPAERTSLHATVARLLESDDAGRLRPGSWAEIAHHWYRAHDLPKALAGSVRAAQQAVGLFAFAEAHAQLERALELWDRVDDAPALAGTSRTAILRQAADAAAGGGELARAIALGQEAVAALSASGDTEGSLDMAHRIAWYQWDHGDAVGAERTIEDALALAGSASSVTRARLTSDLAQLHWSATRYAAQLETAGEAVALADIADDATEQARARMMRGLAHIFLGRFSDGIGELEAVIAALEDGPEDLRSLAGFELSNVLMLVGDNARVITVCQAEIERLRATGTFRRYGAYVYDNLVDALMDTGRWDEVVVLQEDPDWPRDGSRASCWMFSDIAELACRRGDLDRARTAMVEARQRVSPTDSVLDRIWMTRVEGIAARAEGRLEESSQHFWRAIDVSFDPIHDLPLGHWVLPLAVTTEADRADEARARNDPAALEEALARGRRLVSMIDAIAAEATVEGRGPQLAAFVAHGGAEADRLEGRHDPDRWAAAALAFESVDDPWDAAISRYREAEAILLSGGDRKRATEVLRSAHATASRLGAGPLLTDVRGLATRARIDLDAVGPAAALPAQDIEDPYRLSAREREVLALVAEGRTNREIAAALFISDKTASVHVTHILDKMGVSSRVEAALVAARAGLDEAMPEGSIAESIKA